MADLAPASGAVVSGAAGSTAAGSTLTTPRGQLKLSARALGAATASLALSPTVAPGLSPGPPSSTCSEPAFAPVRGTTGPAVGRTDPPGLPLLPRCSGSAGTGSATGISLTAKAALDFSLNVKGKLTSAELRKIDAIART